MHFVTTQNTTNPTTSDSVIQVSSLPGLLHVIALRGNGLKCSVEDDISMNPQFKIVASKSLEQNEGYLSVFYCTNQGNKRLYSFFSCPVDCIWTRSPQHPNKHTLPQNLNVTISLELKQELRKYDDMYSQLQIFWHTVSTYSKSYVKGLNLENEN